MIYDVVDLDLGIHYNQEVDVAPNPVQKTFMIC